MPTNDHFVVFVPGYMGSRLRNRHANDIVCIDLPTIARGLVDPDLLLGQMRYPNDDLEPAGVLEKDPLLYHR